MKKVKIIALSLTIISILFSVLILPKMEIWEKTFKHQISDAIGLKRTVSQLDCNGNPTKTWTGRLRVEITMSGIAFIDENGKEIKISGPYRVEEQ